MEENPIMKVNTRIKPADYPFVVNNIYSGYFNAKNRYVPEFGILNAMNVFYNACVVESKHDADVPHSNTDIVALLPVLEDEDFTNAFAEALRDDKYIFSFARAYQHAMEKVEYNKYPFLGVATDIGDAASSLIEAVKTVVTKENVDNILGYLESNIGNNKSEENSDRS